MHHATFQAHGGLDACRGGTIGGIGPREAVHVDDVICNGHVYLTVTVTVTVTFSYRGKYGYLSMCRPTMESLGRVTDPHCMDTFPTPICDSHSKHGLGCGPELGLHPPHEMLTEAVGIVDANTHQGIGATTGGTHLGCALVLAVGTVNLLR